MGAQREYFDQLGSAPHSSSSDCARDGTMASSLSMERRAPRLPDAVRGALVRHLAQVRQRHRADLADGRGRVVLPDALERKVPNAPTEWSWQFVRPAARRCRDERYGAPSRFHLHESVIPRGDAGGAVSWAQQAGRLSHMFRHFFAKRLLEGGSHIRTVQERLAHADVRTTMVYTHVLNRVGLGAEPAQALVRHVDLRIPCRACAGGAWMCPA